MLGGRVINQLSDDNRRFDLVLRLNDPQRDADTLAELLVETPQGKIPLRRVAEVIEADGPNQIGRENSQRRIVVSANTAGRAQDRVVAEIQARLARLNLPPGYSIRIEGSFRPSSMQCG